MTAVQARLDLIRREMMGPSSAHDAALRLLQAKLAKRGKHVRLLSLAESKSCIL